MTSNSLHTLSSSLQAMPVAMVFSNQMLLTQKAAVPSEAGVPADNRKTDSLTVRATRMTAILKSIPGYSHGGLNE
jgi:hypothetical protein